MESSLHDTPLIDAAPAALGAAEPAPAVETTSPRPPPVFYRVNNTRIGADEYRRCTPKRSD
jgi:hypothetical protein